MYRCEICGVFPPPNTPLNYVIMERRGKRYPHRAKAHPVRIAGKKRALRLDDVGGVGWEIVRRAAACADCAEEHVMPEASAVPDAPEVFEEPPEGEEEQHHHAD